MKKKKKNTSAPPFGGTERRVHSLRPEMFAFLGGSETKEGRRRANGHVLSAIGRKRKKKSFFFF